MQRVRPNCGCSEKVVHQSGIRGEDPHVSDLYSESNLELNLNILCTARSTTDGDYLDEFMTEIYNP